MNSTFPLIVGKTITGMAVSKDGETTLRVDFNDRDPLYVTTLGDCCSESWWADVEGAASCFGSVVTDVRELEVDDDPDDERTRQDIDTVYGFAIDTTLGSITLAFRNSSNGYYGGEAWPIKECEMPEGWHEITTNDWRA